MATASCTFTPNAFPKGHIDHLDSRDLVGTLAIGASPGTYVTNGLPLTSASAQAYSANAPFWGEIHGISGFQYLFDPTNDTVRIFQQDGTTGALTEIGNGVAIPAGVSGDTIYARFTVKRT